AVLHAEIRKRALCAANPQLSRNCRFRVRRQRQGALGGNWTLLRALCIAGYRPRYPQCVPEPTGRGRFGPTTVRLGNGPGQPAAGFGGAIRPRADPTLVHATTSSLRAGLTMQHERFPDHQVGREDDLANQETNDIGGVDVAYIFVRNVCTRSWVAKLEHRSCSFRLAFAPRRYRHPIPEPV